ncbi:PQQ-binding-like beta-propeller repeat protein [Paenibacillus prosopidis]|uniref:PQQ-binding-like beta-propeller repeat protein n=1 Tax=Paenibacillus prosopidis TaxID=630520 RepID=UPI0015F13EC1|nr:PQQ-binding-like beta-propeller repeat protein [Paenibacillus prosopidis]
MNKWRMIVVLGGAILSCVLLLMSSTVSVSASIDRHTSYVGANSESSIVIPTIKPQWTLAMDKPENDWQMGQGVIATGEGKAFYVQNGQMIAINIQSGRRLWKFGSDIKAPLVYKGGRVYAGMKTGIVHAVNAASGKKIWSTSVKAKDSYDIVIESDQLFVLNGDIQAYSIKDGKFQWRDEYSEWLRGPMLIHGDFILMENEVSGAYTYSLLHAFNRKTGKEAWQLGNHIFPIAAKDGTIVSQKVSNLLDRVQLPTLDTVDLKTGKIIKSVQYNPRNVDLTKEEHGYDGNAWISDGRVYISFGSVVYSYPENADPAKTTGVSYFSEFINREVRYAAGPYDGKLIYTDGHSIYGIKTANRMTLFYNTEMTNTIARFDLIGHGMYVAQTDGTMVAIDLIHAKPVLQLQTFGRVFGPTVAENGMIVVQTKGKLLAFKEPQSLKVK